MGSFGSRVVHHRDVGSALNQCLRLGDDSGGGNTWRLIGRVDYWTGDVR